MKFKIEIDLDWIDEDIGIDDQIRNEIVDKLVGSIEEKFSSEISNKLAKKAETIVNAKTEFLINSVLEKPITINNGWKDTREYESIFEMVEEIMTDLYTGKIKSHGECKEDPLLSNIKNYVTKQTKKMLTKVQKTVESKAKEESLKAVNNNELVKALGLVVEKNQSRRGGEFQVSEQ